MEKVQPDTTMFAAPKDAVKVICPKCGQVSTFTFPPTDQEKGHPKE